MRRHVQAGGLLCAFLTAAFGLVASYAPSVALVGAGATSLSGCAIFSKLPQTCEEWGKLSEEARAQELQIAARIRAVIELFPPGEERDEALRGLEIAQRITRAVIASLNLIRCSLCPCDAASTLAVPDDAPTLQELKRDLERARGEL